MMRDNVVIAGLLVVIAAMFAVTVLLAGDIQNRKLQAVFIACLAVAGILVARSYGFSPGDLLVEYQYDGR